MSATTSANEHRQQLQAYGTPLVQYHGHGTVRWKNGTSKDLAVEAGQFPGGKIIVTGRIRTLISHSCSGAAGQSPKSRNFPV
jgi:hypothetical protein